MSALARAVAEETPLIEEVAFTIAEDEYPGLDKAHYRAELDALAEVVAPAVRQAADLRERLEILTAHMYGALGFKGNQDDYYDPKNSYLNDVIERRVGIPITLAVVLMALARRLDIRIEGVGFPGHFLVRAGGPTGVYLDPFTDGRVLARAELIRLAKRFFGDNINLAEGQLEPVDARAMAVRMLFNLQQIYERRGDHARALVVCDRLVDITGEAFHRRDRGIHALALGAAVAAERDLAAYLERAPESRDAASVRELLAKAQKRVADGATKLN
jgi:regulator of sirC expression with transglutaminase-like and TPR domain